MKTFPCGCTFETDNNGNIIFDPDIEKLPKNCPATWDMICDGNTKGIFQLEIQGANAQKVQPRSIEELSDLIAIIRPGCTESFIKGKNLTNHYIDRKHGREDIDYLHPALEPILKNTQGILCIHEDIYISMFDGTEKKIKYLKNYDIVNSINQDSLSCVADICVGIMKSPKKDGVEITLENGFKIILTEDHKVLTWRGPVMVKDLLPSDVIQVATKQCKLELEDDGCESIPLYPTNSHYGYLVGQLMGDGCSGEAICSGTKKNHDRLYEFLTNTFPELNFKEYFHCRSWYISVSSQELLNDSNHGNRKTKYRKFVELLGLDKTKNNKIIPEEIMRSSKSVRRSFLAGLFDADGYSGVSNTGSAIRHFCSANPAIINSVRKLLALEGIKSYIDNEYTHIYAIDTAKFDNVLGRYIIIKDLVGRTSMGERYGSFPKDIIRSNIKSSGHTIKGFCRLTGLNASNLFKNNFASNYIASKCGICFGDINTCKVKSIRKVTNQNFYSVSIEYNHNLIGNGIVISNCYQEQALAIAKELAGYNLQEAELLRKAIGKKNVELMAKIEDEFINKSVKHGILNEEEANEIFSWIKASQRYSFNKSHSYSYAENGYLTAYCKAHFPHEFFTSYLKHAIGKPDTFEEINELVNNARLMDIYVHPPNIKTLQKDFKLVKQSPTFGITNVKRVGNSVYDKMYACYKEYKRLNYPVQLEDMNFDQFLLYYGPCVKSDSMISLILSGACDCFYLNRTEMKHRYEQYKELSKRELEWVSKVIYRENFNSLIECLNFMIINNDWNDKKRPIFRKDRLDIIGGLIDSLENPGYSLEDSPGWRAKNEQEYLGVALTCSKVDEYDISHANCTCKEFIDGFNSNNGIAIAAELKSLREWTIKKGESKGRKMAFLTLSDSTCNLDNVVMFADDYEKCKDRLIEKSVLLFRGVKQKEKLGFLVKNVHPLRT